MGPLGVRWYPARTGWLAVVPEGHQARTFVLRQLTKGRWKPVFAVREVCDRDVYDVGVALGLDHARRLIARWVRDFPEEW